MSRRTLANVSYGTSVVVAWSDVGLARNAAGVLEVNSGVAGSLAALKGTSLYGSTRLVAGGTTATGSDKIEDYGHFRFNCLANANAPTVALAGLGAGNLSNGQYKWAITFVTADGETVVNVTSATLTVTDNTTNGQAAITNIPVDPTGRATKRRIYRTKVNAVSGSQVFFLVATISDNTTTTYTDNVADASLGVLGSTSDNTTAGLFYVTDGSTVSKIIHIGWPSTGSSQFGNVGLGPGVFPSLAGGYGNTAVGYSAGAGMTTGFRNTLVGAGVGQSMTSATNCTVVGYSAGASLTSADQAVFYGFGAGNKTTTGFQNTFVGSEAGQNNVTGGSNTAVGQQALQNLQGGSSGNPASNCNTAIGTFAGINVSSGSDNVMIGYSAGYTNVSANATTTGGQNTFVGRESGQANSSAQYSGSIALGYRAQVGASGTCAIGGTGTNSVQAVINGTTAVGQLDVNSNSASRTPIIANGASGQTANLIEARVNGGSAVFAVLPSGVTKKQVLTVGTLPSPAVAGAGAEAIVTDATSNTFGAAAVGGGTNKVPVYCPDGTQWLIG